MYSSSDEIPTPLAEKKTGVTDTYCTTTLA